MMRIICTAHRHLEVVTEELQHVFDWQEFFYGSRTVMSADGGTVVVNNTDIGQAKKENKLAQLDSLMRWRSFELSLSTDTKQV
jgi:hypothetical protein